MEYDPATLAFYAAEAPAYAERWREKVSPHLDAFLGRLARGAHILEVGCGGGQDAAAMLAAGFDVDPTDGCAALAAEAGRRLGRPVRLMRFDELVAEDAYDAVWAAACLLHVPRAGLPGVLSRIYRALKPSGLHFATYKATGREGRDRFGRLFNQPTATELREAYARSAAWEVLALEEGEGGGYESVQAQWVAITAKKA